jgi:hypothetical protein
MSYVRSYAALGGLKLLVSVVALVYGLMLFLPCRSIVEDLESERTIKEQACSMHKACNGHLTIKATKADR